jgi:hypothetical protein
MYFRPARDYFYFRACFVQKRRGLERTLPTPNDNNFLVFEPAQISLFRCVRSQRGGNVRKL